MVRWRPPLYFASTIAPNDYTMPKTSSRQKPMKTAKLGALPEWNLSDLYAGLDSPEIKRDLEQADSDCAAFEQEFKGRLSALATGEGAGGALAAAVRRYELIDDRLGRLISYASLVYAGNTTDPVSAKFYGDIQERITAASLHLLFFTLELNRIDDAQLEAAMRDPALGHYRPWIEDVRKEKPYQLEDRVEELFHEKSVTGYSAWNCLFDESIAGLRFKVAGKSLAIEPTLNLMQDSDGKKRKAAAEALAKTFKENLRPFALITEYARQGQGDFRSVAWLQGHCGRAAPFELRRARGRRGASGGCARCLSETIAPLLRTESQMVRQEKSAALGSQRTVAESGTAHDFDGATPAPRSSPLTVLSLRGRLRLQMNSSPRAGSMRRCARASSRVPFPIQRCLRPILMSCSTTWVSRAM